MPGNGRFRWPTLRPREHVVVVVVVVMTFLQSRLAGCLAIHSTAHGKNQLARWRGATFVHVITTRACQATSISIDFTAPPYSRRHVSRNYDLEFSHAHSRRETHIGQGERANSKLWCRSRTRDKFPIIRAFHERMRFACNVNCIAFRKFRIKGIFIQRCRKVATAASVSYLRSDDVAKYKFEYRSVIKP